MNKQWVAAAMILLAGVAGLFLLNDKEGQKQSAGQGPRPTFVNVMQPRSDSISDQIETVGSTLALSAVDITSETDGRITEIHFTEGQGVSEGDLLVSLEDRQAQADLAVAEAQAHDAQARFRRAQRLRESNNISQAEFDELDAARQVAQARVQASRTRLEQHKILAPFDGVTGLRQVSRGAYLQSGQAVTTLDSIDPIEVLFAIPERFVGMVSLGLPVAAFSDAYPGETFKGEITSLATRIDPVGRNLRVKAQLANKGARLRPGQFMTIRLTLRKRQALLIPEEALLTRGDTHIVYVVRDDSAEERTLQLGLRRNGEAEVVEGLTDDDLVVINGQARLRDGGPVQVVDDPDALISDRKPRPNGQGG